MTASLTTIVPKLEKLLPLLSSSQPGRTLKQAGADPQVTRLLIRVVGVDRYAVDLDGETLIGCSRDLEHDAARELLKRGITGKAETYDTDRYPIAKGVCRMRFDIETFAGTTVEETSGGLRVRKYRPDRFQKASPEGGIRSQAAFPAAGGTGHPEDPFGGEAT